MMLPLQLDLLTPPNSRWLMEWKHEGKWIFETVRNTIEEAVKEGKRRLRDIPFVTWRVRPYEKELP